MRGASVLQTVLDGIPNQPVSVLVVWQSILPTDWARPGAGIVSRVRDPRARQYWDEDNLFPRKLGARMSSDPTHPDPSCCWHNDIPWDLVAVYPAGARWEGALPAAVFIDGPVYAVRSEFVKALNAVSVGLVRSPESVTQ